MSVRLVCVRAPRGIRSILRFFVRKKSNNN